MARLLSLRRVGTICALACALTPASAHAQPNGQALTPPMGWTTWTSLQTDIDEDTIKAIASVQASTLAPYGYRYVNVDGGWYQNPDAAVDAHGRWVADPAKFPGGMAALGDYIHGLGLGFGIYVTPGIPALAWVYNTPIEGTPYHAADIAIPSRRQDTYLGGTMFYIDYTAPGSQEFINSWANLFASWGVDYLKLDAVGDWNIPDIRAWSIALRQTGRPMHLALSNNLNPSFAGTWRQHANGWRISPDIEAYNGETLTTWEHVADRFARVPLWLGAAGAGGWNDLDSVVAGGPNTGLTPDERQSVMSLWALAASPLIIGDDLRTLDAFGIGLLTNPEVIAVNQGGVSAAPLNASAEHAVWVATGPDGSYAVGLFNRGASTATITVPWSSLGFSGSASVRDLWRRTEVGSFSGAFSAELRPHASMLVRVTPHTPVQQLRATAGSLSAWAFLGASRVSAGGERAQYVGFGSTLTFPAVTVTYGGWYDLTINFINGDAAARASLVSVNGQTSLIAFPPAGDWAEHAVNQGITTAVFLAPGSNIVTFWNPFGWAPDLIGITLQSKAHVAPAFFKIINVSTGRALDARFALNVSGNPIVSWFENASLDQHWEITGAESGQRHATNRSSGQALDLYAPAIYAGLPVVQRPYDGRASQQWRAVATGRGTFVLINQATGLVLRASTEWMHAKVEQWWFSADRDEEWRFVPVM